MLPSPLTRGVQLLNNWQQCQIVKKRVEKKENKYYTVCSFCIIYLFFYCVCSISVMHCIFVCAVRLKAVLEQMDRGMVDLQELRRHLELAAAMLDAVYTDETRWAWAGCWMNGCIENKALSAVDKKCDCFSLQAPAGHWRWAQWLAGGVGAERGAWLAGVHLQQEDGCGQASPWREAKIQEHCSCSAGWDICREVNVALIS